MKPPFAYGGAKGRLATRIAALIPKHTVYVEPFAGSAAVMFAKPLPPVTNRHHYREVLNDLNGDVVNFFRVLRDKEKCDKLLEILELTPFALEEFKAAFVPANDDIEAAVKFFVAGGMSFAHAVTYNTDEKMQISGFARVLFGSNEPATYNKRVQRLHTYTNRLLNTTIDKTPALKCIEQWDSPHTFFYVDPPYPSSDQRAYANKFDVNDLQTLVNTLDKAQGSFILSNYPQPDVSFPQDWYRVDINTQRSASGYTDNTRHLDHTKTEVLWARDACQAPRKEIQKVYDGESLSCFKNTIKEALDDK